MPDHQGLVELAQEEHWLLDFWLELRGKILAKIDAEFLKVTGGERVRISETSIVFGICYGASPIAPCIDLQGVHSWLAEQ